MGFEYEFIDVYYSYHVDDPAVWSPSDADHCHSLYEILYFVDGDGEFVIEKQRCELKPGSMVFMPPGFHHHVQLHSARRYERYVIRFSEYLIPMEILPSIQRCEGIYDVSQTVMPQLFARFSEHERNVGGDVQAVKWLFRCVLTEILVYFSLLSRDVNITFSVLKDDIAVVLDYISQNLERPLCLDDICAEFHYSKSYICREFMASMGKSVMQYIREAKMAYADALIRIGMPLTDVAAQCGYSNYATFYRVYRKVNGRSPSGRAGREQGGKSGEEGKDGRDGE